MTPAGDDVIFVPVILFDDIHQSVGISERRLGHLAVGADNGLLSAFGEHPPAALVVKSPGVSAGPVDVGLVANGVALRGETAANLDSGIGRGRPADAVLELQFEVIYFAQFPGEELVTLDRIVLR